MREKILAIDIGGSKIVVGLVDKSGRVLESEKIKLPEGYDAEYLTRTICQRAERFVKEKPIAVGVTIPGLADAKQGVWSYAPFSSVSEFPIAEFLSRRLGLTTYIENDVNACAVGEKIFGCCQNSTDFLWVTVSNGIGGALYLNDRLYVGLDGNAGEIGHFIVADSNRKCGCGKTGCLEVMASGRGISQNFFETTGQRITAEEIARFARLGNEQAKDSFKRAGEYLGKAFSYAVNLLNLPKIVLGGGVSESFDLLKESIETVLQKNVFIQANKRIEITRTSLGYHAALIGAAAIAFQGVEKE